MKIKLIAIAQTSQSFVQEGLEEYAKRLKNFVSFEFVAIKDIKNAKNLSKEELKKKEGEEILKLLENGDHIILLDDKGKMYTSMQFADFILKKQNLATKSVVFIIGGAYGFSEDVYAKSQEKLSLSPMTFSHQMIRMIFAEQLYRAYAIINHLPYHHE
mgnify:CR=1 FL=1